MGVSFSRIPIFIGSIQLDENSCEFNTKKKRKQKLTSAKYDVILINVTEAANKLS